MDIRAVARVLSFSGNQLVVKIVEESAKIGPVLASPIFPTKIGQNSPLAKVISLKKDEINWMITATLRMMPKLTRGKSHIAPKEAIGAKKKKSITDMFTIVVDYIP